MLKTHFALDNRKQDYCGIYNVNDVLNKNQCFRRIRYDIFHISYNGWAHKAITEQMQKRNIRYGNERKEKMKH